MSFSFHESRWRSRARTLITHGPVFGEHSTGTANRNITQSLRSNYPAACV
jgi:hypothetical protein